MISAGDFRNGVTIEFEGNIYQIIEFQHVKPGKGAAFVRTKLKNIISGGVVEKTFRPTEKCPTAHIDRKDMQYLYADDDFYHFMDVETYDQIDLPKDEVGDALKFVKENEMCKVCSHKGNVFAVEPPLFVELTVTETEPGFKGDTATGATKPATVETGATVYVPLFVETDDVIKIDTRTGEYLHVYNLYFYESAHIPVCPEYVQAFLFVCCVAGENPDSKCHKHMRHKHSPQICIYPIVGDEKHNHQDSYRTGEQIDEEHLLCFTQTVQYAAEHSAYVHQWAQKTQSSKKISTKLG